MFLFTYAVLCSSKAWALKECGSFACDVLRLRRLDLWSGGREYSRTLSEEQLAGTRDRVVRAWQMYSQQRDTILH